MWLLSVDGFVSIFFVLAVSLFACRDLLANDQLAPRGREPSIRPEAEVRGGRGA